MLLLCSDEEGGAAPSHLLAADFAISVATPAASAFCDVLWSSTAMAAHLQGIPRMKWSLSWLESNRLCGSSSTAYALFLKTNPARCDCGRAHGSLMASTLVGSLSAYCATSFCALPRASCSCSISPSLAVRSSCGSGMTLSSLLRPGAHTPTGYCNPALAAACPLSCLRCTNFPC